MFFFSFLFHWIHLIIIFYCKIFKLFNWPYIIFPNLSSCNCEHPHNKWNSWIDCKRVMLLIRCRLPHTDPLLLKSSYSFLMCFSRISLFVYHYFLFFHPVHIPKKYSNQRLRSTIVYNSFIPFVFLLHFISIKKYVFLFAQMLTCAITKYCVNVLSNNSKFHAWLHHYWLYMRIRYYWYGDCLFNGLIVCNFVKKLIELYLSLSFAGVVTTINASFHGFVCRV